MASRRSNGAFGTASRLPWNFVRDFVDRGAHKNASRLGMAEQIAGVATALTALFAFLDIVRKTLDGVVGAPGVVVQLALLVVAIGGCVHIITARNPLSRSAEPSYRFGTLIRTAAKVLILVLLAYVLPRSISATAEHYARLPALFGSYLVDAHTGEPIVDASARVIVEGQGDIGGSAWPSDSSGFSVIQLNHAVPRRQATLSVYSEKCGSHNVPLTKSAEQRATNRPPPSGGGPTMIFRHVIACRASQ